MPRAGLMMLAARFGIFLAAASCASSAAAAPLTVPFDFNRGEIALSVDVNGVPAYALLDTGVDPSAVDQDLAKAAHLPVDKGAGGEVSGEGSAKAATAYPARIVGLSIGGRRFAPFDALASDMSAMSADYGRTLNVILGYSFLSRRAVLIDYDGETVTFLDRGADASASVKTCQKRFQQPLELLKGFNWPVIAAFSFGAASAPVSLDTGSNSGVALYQSALALPGVQAALQEAGTVGHGGFRGDAEVKAYTLNAPIGFGPFHLPPGQAVTVRQDVGSTATRVANVGNRVFAAMKLKILLDYPARQVTFWSDCS